MRLRTGLPTVLLAALLTAGCTSSTGSDAGAASSSSPADDARVVTGTPQAATTLVADADPVASAVSMSRALYRQAPVVVLADADDQAGLLLGSSAAVGLGVPLLLTRGAAGAADVVGPELDRLGTADVLAVGDATPPAGKDRDVVTVPADARALDAATGLSLADVVPVPAGDEATAIVALDPAAPAALTAVAGTPATSSSPASSATGASPTSPTSSGTTSAPATSPSSASSSSASSSSPSSSTKAAATSSGGRQQKLPTVRRAEPLTDTVVLTTGSPESLAGIASARAAGVDVLVTPGTTDPRTSQDAVTRLGADRPRAVVALGAGYSSAPGLDWQLATAETGIQLPGGGQVLFPGRMMVALYGVPGSGALGVLGEQDLPASIQRAKATAAPYDALVDTPVVPTFEIIATVASGSAGPDGDYSNEGDVEALRPWVEAAGAAGMFVVLDLQPGRADFLSQAKQYQSLLELPYVGLALDPEWRLTPGQLPLQQVGQVGVDEINQVVTWLADLTRAGSLPQKLLVLHQFQVRMITDLERLDTSRSELAILIHADGQGGQPAKQGTWAVLHKNAPPGVFWGWKNFYDEDKPVLTPQQTIEQALPTPELITYQ